MILVGDRPEREVGVFREVSEDNQSGRGPCHKEFVCRKWVNRFIITWNNQSKVSFLLLFAPKIKRDGLFLVRILMDTKWSVGVCKRPRTPSSIHKKYTPAEGGLRSIEPEGFGKRCLLGLVRAEVRWLVEFSPLLRRRPHKAQLVRDQ